MLVVIAIRGEFSGDRWVHHRGGVDGSVPCCSCSEHGYDIDGAIVERCVLLTTTGVVVRGELDGVRAPSHGSANLAGGGVLELCLD
jgi:hypothetical protein